jgi:phenylacetate-CoA ligase
MTLQEAHAVYRERVGPRVLEVVANASGRVPALDRRLREAGLGTPLATLDDLGRLPVLSKDALPALQGRAPFGGLVADGVRVVRAFASPGPIYEPQLTGDDPWRWRSALAATGISDHDVVLNCFSYHLSPAGAMFDEACRAIGATVVPGGVGMTEVQALAIADLGVTAYIGLPSYLASLVAAYDAAGLPADRWRLTKALVTAEPLPTDLRTRLMERVPVVLMAYGTAEAGNIGYETAADGGLRLDEGVYVELCDPATGTPVAADEPGEVVVSVLAPDYPLVRFGTGDVSCWMLADGELRLAGVLGRVGAAVKVRGMFVHPHQAAEVVAALRDDGADGAAFTVERVDGVDVLFLDLVASTAADHRELTAAAERRSRDLLRVRPRVRLVDSLSADGALFDRR